MESDLIDWVLIGGPCHGLIEKHPDRDLLNVNMNHTNHEYVRHTWYVDNRLYRVGLYRGVRPYQYSRDATELILKHKPAPIA